jgi:enoyl-CoA hydratase/carnithine racemase
MTSLVIDIPQGGVCRMRIDRPKARNAIDATVRAELATALAEAETDHTVRSVLIGGMGGQFCAGGDLPTMVGISQDAARARMAEGAAIVAHLWRFPKPVTVALERYAIGAAAGIAMLADHVVMGDGAVIGLPFLKLGLVPDWGLMMTLAWRAGPAVASRLCREATNVPAAESLAHGLVDDIVPDDRVMAHALDVAGRAAALPPLAFARMKAGLRRADIATALAEESMAQRACLIGAEFMEGYDAFTTKRVPKFQYSVKGEQ